MKYQILLSDRRSGRQALIVCPSDMILEKLCLRIQLELQLPFTDYGFHRFLFRGKKYVIDEHIATEAEKYKEATGRQAFNFRSSEHIRLYQCFTVLESAIAYHQDDPKQGKRHKVCCTLIARIPDHWGTKMTKQKRPADMRRA